MDDFLLFIALLIGYLSSVVSGAQLCENNDTFVVYRSNVESVLGLKGNEVVGSLGKIFDGFLVKKNRRKCKLVGDEKFGK